MIKKKKIVRFRELYYVIEELLDSYTYEDTVKILKKDHDLDLTKGTLRNYLFQHRQYLSELPQKPVTQPNNINSVKAQVLTDESLELEEAKKIDADSESDNEDDEEIDYDALLEQFKNKHKTKSLLDK